MIFGRRKPAGPPPSPPARSAPSRAKVATHTAEQDQSEQTDEDAVPADLGDPGPRFDRHSPFYIGFYGGLGFVLASWLFGHFERIGGVVILIVVSLFIAAGLNPSVEWFQRRRLRRSLAVTMVIVLFLIGVALFLWAIVPVIQDQVAAITDNAPGWFDQLQRNRQVQEFDEQFDVIDKVREYVQDGNFTSGIFGGVLGLGLRLLGALANGFLIIVLTLYFLSSLEATKGAVYRLAPASRRERVSKLGDRVVASVGGYVAGAFVVAICAGVSSLIFLLIVGLGEYAVALAFVVMLLDVIPMIGATIGAVIVSAIGFATDVKIGLFCVIFYVIYQQLENYVLYPRVMSRSVDIPGAVTVIAALVGASLLGVVGALLAIPTAAAILLIVREVFIRRQDAR